MSDIFTTELLQKIKRLRKYFRLSQEDVAFALGITQPAYRKIETGKTVLTVLHLCHIVARFKYTLIDFLSHSVEELIRIASVGLQKRSG